MLDSATLSFRGLMIVLAVTFIEWVDFSIYLYLAPSVFAKLFFPPSEYGIALTFGLYAISYLARPLGGWWLGRLADVIGRKIPLMASALLMGVSTLGICLLPSYDNIGILATWLLLLCRIGQGISVGGESNTSAMYLIEHYPKSPVVIGTTIAAIGALSMAFAGLLTFFIQIFGWPPAWRIIFAALGVLSIWISYKRRQLNESPEFEGHSLTLSSMWQTHRSGIINVALVSAYTSFIIYMCNVFWTTYAKQVHMFPPSWVTACITIAQTLAAGLALSTMKRVPPEKIKWFLLGSCVFMSTAAPLLFSKMALIHHSIALLGVGFYICGNACLSLSLYYFLYLQLPANGRCFAVSFIWGVSASLGAISLPLVQFGVQKGFHDLPIIVVWAASISLALTLMPQMSLMRTRALQE